MSKKSNWFLAGASAAMLLNLAHVLGMPVGEGMADFSISLSAALMVGVLINLKSC